MRRLFILLGLLILIGGCALFPHKSAGPPGKLPIPAGLHGVTIYMDWLVFIGVVGLAAGVAAYIIIPGDHKIAFGAIAGSASMLGLALFVQTSLPFLPWIFGGACLLSLLWLWGRVRKGKIKSFNNLFRKKGK